MIYLLFFLKVLKKIVWKNHLIYEIDLLENSFLVNDIESDVPCVFQIWQRKEEIRKDIDKKTQLHFTFVKKEYSPDISFSRVGVNTETIMKKII